MLMVVAEASAQMENSSLPEGTVLLEEIRQRVIKDLAEMPNYVCVDSIERSLGIPGERGFRRLDHIHLELAHIEGTDQFAWLSDSAFQLKAPSELVGYGASFRGDFGDNRALVFNNSGTRISYSEQAMMEGRPALHYEYQVPPDHGRLTVTIGNDSGFAAAQGEFWADPETLDLVRMDISGYDIPPRLSVSSIAARTMYW